MALEIEINGSAAPTARYIANTPSPCRIRQTPASANVQVKLESKPAQTGGGQAVFYATPGAKSQATLQLTLPASGLWVPFGLGGKFQVPSVDDRDCLLIATAGTQTLTVPLMVRVRKNADKLQPRERDRFLNALAKLNARGTYQTFRDIHVLGANNVVYAQEHAGPQFLPWHRTYLLDLERELQAIDPAVSLHYWRFDQPAANVFKNTFMGATRRVSPGGPPSNVTFVAGHPLSGWVTDGVPGILRSAIFDTQTKAAPGPPGFPLLARARRSRSAPPTRRSQEWNPRRTARRTSRSSAGSRRSPPPSRTRSSSCCTPTSIGCGASGSGSTSARSLPARRPIRHRTSTAAGSATPPGPGTALVTPPRPRLRAGRAAADVAVDRHGAGSEADDRRRRRLPRTNLGGGPHRLWLRRRAVRVLIDEA